MAYLTRRLQYAVLAFVCAVYARPAPADDDLAADALRIYREHQNFVACGDSMYSVRSDGKILQRKNLQFRVERAIPLTKLDRLNAIEWKGILAISFEVGREFDSASRWSDWYEDDSKESHFVYRKKGEWIVNRSSTDFWTADAVACQTIPPD